MTAKERREMQHLRNENAELKATLHKHLEIYRDNIFELVRYKTAYTSLCDALADSLREIEEAPDAHR